LRKSYIRIYTLYGSCLERSVIPVKVHQFGSI
jgi:hypothetical protein